MDVFNQIKRDDGRLLLSVLQDLEGAIKVADASIEALVGTKQRIFGVEPTLSAGLNPAMETQADCLSPQIADAMTALRARLGKINGLANELSERL